MSLLPLSFLAAHRGVAEADLPANAQGMMDQAEGIVGAYIGSSDPTGLGTLASRTLIFSPIRSTFRIPFNYGPASSVQNLTIDTIVRTADIQFIDPWSCLLSTEVVAGADVTGIMTTGWANENDTPLEIRSAILGVWDFLSTGVSQGVGSLRIGDYAVGAVALGGNFLDKSFGHLLRRWRHPMVF